MRSLLKGPRLSLAAVLVLLVPMVVVLYGQAPPPTQLEVQNPAVTAAPFCSATTTVDCVVRAIVYDSQGGAQVASVPASAFTVNGSTASAIIPLPATSKRFGTVGYTAKFEVRTWDGVLSLSDLSAPVSYFKDPPKPVLVVR